MIKRVSAKQIQYLDNIAINQYKIESLFLMENAGRAIADEVANMLNNKKTKKIAILCGKGNNGGDGLVAARYLINKGFEVKNFLLAKVKEITSDAYANLDLLAKTNHKIIEIPDRKTFYRQKGNIKDCPVIIDAIFGVGLKGEVKEPFKTIIDFLNCSKKMVISIDVPSGLDATTGLPLGTSVKADRTISFSLAKKGFFINQGSNFVGRLKIVDIGIPKKLIDYVCNKSK